MTGLSDSFQRPINYLRISVTDRCNLRCTYCMPDEGVPLAPHNQMLSFEEIRSIATAAASAGITKIRLTGGEPLVRLDIIELVKMLAAIEGIDDLALTTNAILLEKYAVQLKEAGLKRVNISLDSLQKDKFRSITRIGALSEAFAGIRAAHKAGLEPIKINVVAMRGVNDDEIADFAKITIEKSWHVRFIELMPFEGNQAANKWFMPRTEIEQRVRATGELTPVFDQTGHGPARYFKFPNAKGTVGFISSVTEHICMSCNRLRLTADGKLRPCLLSDNEIDLREPLRNGATGDDLKNFIEQAVANKPKGHELVNGSKPKKRNMAQIGG
ncbi:MAG: GTP 3',8-cyclase MoaA [Chloroflexi bacterium]|jgi:GTP 3',8-cyclase|nr:GTP 3',8-cyclase MoaA [Chloroflexota bacterium]MBT7081082.1 GTP 3',8-cyclase MoaA [Chloroflexota bacterium]MBT7289481.1 GTP 3',8-cyclase MoaA [Chloroflexota bacterium]